MTDSEDRQETETKVETMTCQICAHADEHGWWGQDGTHCRGCHRSWTSLAQSHCTVCHRHFGSNKAGDAHNVKGACIDPKGVDRWETPNGPIFGGRDPAASKRSIEAARLAR